MLDFVLVAEGKTDERVIPALADRVLLEEGDDWIKDHVEWIKDNPKETADPLWQWVAIDAGTGHRYTSWTWIRQRGEDYKNRLRIFRKPGDGDRKAETRKAIALCTLLRKDNPADAIVLARDLDKKPDEHRKSMEQAREEAQSSSTKSLTVLLATPNKVIEAWMLNGFLCENNNEHEKKQLQSLRQEFGFDPCLKAHLLSGDNAQRVISQLISDNEGNEDRSRRERCWTHTDLQTLREQGKKTYLKHFLDEVKDQLLPLLTGKPSIQE